MRRATALLPLGGVTLLIVGPVLAVWAGWSNALSNPDRTAGGTVASGGIAGVNLEVPAQDSEREQDQERGQDTERDQDPVDDAPQTPMRAKLGHSQKILEGLALAEFEQIERHARDLVLINLESEWEPLKTVEYLLQGAEFRRVASELQQAAKEENIDWATLVYMEMTMKCVQCHKHIRDLVQP